MEEAVYPSLRVMMPGRMTQQMRGFLANPNAVLSTSHVKVFFDDGPPLMWCVTKYLAVTPAPRI